MYNVHVLMGFFLNSRSEYLVQVCIETGYLISVRHMLTWFKQSSNGRKSLLTSAQGILINPVLWRTMACALQNGPVGLAWYANTINQLKSRYLKNTVFQLGSAR